MHIPCYSSSLSPCQPFLQKRIPHYRRYGWINAGMSLFSCCPIKITSGIYARCSWRVHSSTLYDFTRKHRNVLHRNKAVSVLLLPPCSSTLSYFLCEFSSMEKGVHFYLEYFAISFSLWCVHYAVISYFTYEKEKLSFVNFLLLQGKASEQELQVTVGDLKRRHLEGCKHWTFESNKMTQLLQVLINV